MLRWQIEWSKRARKLAEDTGRCRSMLSGEVVLEFWSEVGGDSVFKESKARRRARKGVWEIYISSQDAEG